MNKEKKTKNIFSLSQYPQLVLDYDNGDAVVQRTWKMIDTLAWEFR